MNRFATASVLLILVLAIGAAPAAAKGFSPSRVPATAEGVIHLNLARAKKTKLWQGSVSYADIAELQAKMAREVAKKAGGNDRVGETIAKLFGHVRTVTIWVDASENGAIVVDVDPAFTPALQSLFAELGASSKKKRGATIYRDKDDDTRIAHIGSLWIMGETEGEVLMTIDALQGKGKTLGNSKKLAVNLSSQDVFLAAGVGGALMDGLRNSARAKMLQADIKSMGLHIGEHKGEFFLRARAVTDSEQTANKLVAIASGLSALVSLADDDPELQELVKALKVKAAGNVVEANLAVPVADILTAMKKAQK